VSLPAKGSGDQLWAISVTGASVWRAGQKLGITVKAVARGRDGTFLPTGICWMVERSFAWISCYRRLNMIFERTKEHLVAFIEVAFVSILSRRLKRLASQDVSARCPRTAFSYLT
jgi:hypothetical protein